MFHPENEKIIKALQLLKKILSHPPNNNYLNIKTFFQLVEKMLYFHQNAN